MPLNRELWEGRKPIVSPRPPADPDKISIGWEVYSLSRRIVDDPIGGVIVREWPSVDDETGEIVRSFLVVDRWQGIEFAFNAIELPDVNLETALPLDRWRLSEFVRDLCRHVAAGTSRLTDRDVDLLGYGHRVGVAVREGR